MRKFYSVVCLAVVFVFGTGFVFGQTSSASTGATVVNLAKAEVPREAKKSGLGGKISVKVSLDENGKAISASVESGPDWICPSVIRSDVVALRNAAIAAAMKSKFSPAVTDGKAMTSMIRVDFDFPKADSSKARDADSTAYKRTRVSEGTIFTAADENKTEGNSGDIPPPDYVGPVPKTDGYKIKDKFSQVSPVSSDKDAKAITGGVLNGRAYALPKPPYPPAARAVRASGTVSVQVLIDIDGLVFSAEPVSGHPLLRSATRIAACSAKFTPTRLQDIPVKVSGIITYNFVP